MPLIFVIGSLGLLSLLGLSILSSGATAFRVVRNVSQAASTDALFEAAISRAVLGLLTTPLPARWRADGSAHDFIFDGTPMRIRVQDELGRIDINRADAPLLSGLFRSAGLDETAVSRLVDQIMDWRDPTPLKRLNGAKEQDYREAGRPYHPRNGPFQSRDELQLVLDMTPAVFGRVAPAITVYSGRQFIDPQIAPREALLALPSLDPTKVDALLTARAQQGPVALPGDVSDPFEALKGRAFTISAAIGPDTRPSLYEAAIRLTGIPTQPYWIMAWTHR